MTEQTVVVYAQDCVVHGALDLSAERLTDHLNASDRVQLRHVTIQAHEDGRVVRLDDLVLVRDEIYAVETTGPRGGANRRVRTKQSRLEAVLGPYLVLGLLHGPPAGEPIGALMNRPAMVPLTSATIAFDMAAEKRTRNVGTIIVNRKLIDSVRAPNEALLQDVAELMPSNDPAAQDYHWLAYAYRTPPTVH
jgi:hypothetical protein